MKHVLRQQPVFTLILLFLVSGTYSQTARSSQSASVSPFAQFEIQKADPVFLQKLSGVIPNNHENELAGDFRHKNLSPTNDLMNTALTHSFFPDHNLPGNCGPIVQTGFEGNPQTQYFLLPVGFGPSECDIAISNAGKIVSISNAWMHYYNENGTLVFSDSLSHFGNGILDGHVLYDPKADRFVFAASYGYYNADPFVLIGYGTIIGFSKSNNPMNGWNLYQLPYTDFHDNTTGDYPLLAISDNEIFITLDYYNAGSRYKHVEIIQINKEEGYAGSESLTSQKYDAPLTGKIKGTMVPAQGGSTTYGPNMYFIMANESGNSSNKYYVYEITNTISSGQAVLNRYGPVTSNISYSACGYSYQAGGIPLLNINAPHDSYMEDAFFENGILQFCQHTNVNDKAAICLGRISGIPDNLTCSAKTISNPNLYLSFPSMAYAGNSSTDNSAILGMEHTGANSFPGLSAVYVNSNFEISALTTVKNGADTINGLWGDFSGICRRYNHPGEVWFEGQYGSMVFPAINWIAKLNSPANCDGQSMVSTIQIEKLNPGLKVYPNPVSNATSISFTIDEAQNVSLKIFDARGKMVKNLANALMQKGQYEIIWNTADIGPGIYVLQFIAGDFSESKEISVIK